MEYSKMHLAPEILEQQRAYKEAKEALKASIKELNVKQVRYKDLRRTIRYTGERELTPAQAAARHSITRQKLKLHYLAYQIMRALYGGYKKVDPLKNKPDYYSTSADIAESMMSEKLKIHTY